MHVVAAQHAGIPSTTRLTFALGADDGAPLHFDVFEDPRGIADDKTVEQPTEHRLVLRAHLMRERGFDQNIVVTFDLGADGLLSIAPTKPTTPGCALRTSAVRRREAYPGTSP